MIQVIDSIPWVRCASGNVYFIYSDELETMLIKNQNAMTEPFWMSIFCQVNRKQVLSIGFEFHLAWPCPCSQLRSKTSPSLWARLFLFALHPLLYNFKVPWSTHCTFQPTAAQILFKQVNTALFWNCHNPLSCDIKWYQNTPKNSHSNSQSHNATKEECSV